MPSVAAEHSSYTIRPRVTPISINEGRRENVGLVRRPLPLDSGHSRLLWPRPVTAELILVARPWPVIRSRCILEMSVVLDTPSLATAPFHPPMTQFVACNVAKCGHVPLRPACDLAAAAGRGMRLYR
jgi:hypothetical protein